MIATIDIVCVLMDWEHPLNYFPILVMVRQYIRKCTISLSGCLAFSGLFEGQFEGVNIPFYIVYCAALCTEQEHSVSVDIGRNIVCDR